MKLQGHANKLDTNAQGESQDFGIGDASVVIDILRNRLYSHKIRTMTQEYICNARDSHRELGKYDNKFEVTVPTRLNPVFKVRDFGPGISPDRMANVFIKYGSSTKRSTDNQTGGFGLGAKSGWCYTDSFTITTFIEGIKRSYVAHIGVNNQGRLDLVSSGTTEEANGTEIQVAVKGQDTEEFTDSVFRAIYFWDERPTLKGVLDVPSLVKGVRVGNNVEVIDAGLLPGCIEVDRYDDNVLAVIDGIPYPIKGALYEKVRALTDLGNLVNKQLILHFGNGVVEVSASRESIADSAHTIHNLGTLVVGATKEVKTFISDAFKKVKTNKEYLATYSEMSKHFDVDKFAKFGDYSITQNRICSELFKKVKVTMAHCLDRRGYNKIQKITKETLSDAKKEIQIDLISNLFFMNKEETSVQQNKRLREFFKNNKRAVIFEANGDAAAFSQVMKDLDLKDFHALTYMEAPKVAKVKIKRENEQICLHTLTGSRHHYITLATNEKKWLYIPLEDGSFPSHSSSYKGLSEYLGEEAGLEICGVSPKALKMVEGDKNFSPLSEWIEAYKPSAAYTQYVKCHKSQHGNPMNLVSSLNDLDDKFLVEMSKEYKKLADPRGKNGHRIHSIPEVIYEIIEKTDEVKEFKANDKKLGELLKSDYPLLSSIDTYRVDKKEVTFYINAKFAESKGK